MNPLRHFEPLGDKAVLRDSELGWNTINLLEGSRLARERGLLLGES